jgi:hypothetical protein
MLGAFTYADTNSANRTASGSTTFDSSGGDIDSSTTGGTTADFIRDPNGNVIGERTGTSASKYFLKDVLGSVTAVINGYAGCKALRTALGSRCCLLCGRGRWPLCLLLLLRRGTLRASLVD